MSVYSKVPIKKPGRNAFNLSHIFKCSMNIGELVPIARPIECVPGDTMITGNISKVELSPIVTNFKGDLYLETWQFFVSNDMLYEKTDSGKFTEILASLQNPQNILPLPYNNLTGNSNPRNYITYLYGVNANNLLNTSYINSIIYPRRGYVKIVNEFFRDENLENEYNFTTNPINSPFYNINYKKDRYTSAFLTTQKGNEIRFNIGTSAPIKLKNGVLNYSDFIGYGSTSAQAYANPNAPTPGDLYSPVLASFSDGAGGAGQAAAGERFKNLIVNGFEADLSVTQGITINDLRLYNKLQKWQERNQLCGTRMKEYLLSNYGVTPNDETLQRPVLIGHTKVPVVVSEFAANIQQTNSSTETYQNYQGSRGATANADSAFKYGKWFCKEFGWILTLGALRPKAVYTGGIHRSLIKDNVVDFFNPIFQHLGQQPIKKAELLLTNNKTNNNSVFGFQDIYNEMRHIEDFIAPDLLNTGYQTKNIFRTFGTSQPTLSRSFIEIKATDYDYLFAVPSTTAPQALVESTNIIKAIRPLSKYGTPSL